MENIGLLQENLFLLYGNNKGTNRPCSLISAIVILFLESIGLDKQFFSA